MIVIPDTLRFNIQHEWGQDGTEWLSKLPDIIERCKTLWNIEVTSSALNLTYNYVAFVRLCDGSRAVLKVAYPHMESNHEMHFLRQLDGRLAPKVIDSSDELNASLIERITPGTPLTQIQSTNDEESTRLAAGLLKNFPVEVPSNCSYPALAEWAEVFSTIRQRGCSPIPDGQLAKAEALFQELNSSCYESALLHGDLHHENILLDANKGWIAIDPKGVIGEPLFNAARFLNNPRPQLIELPELTAVMERRLELIASEFGSTEDRLAAWAYVDCILSASWWVESGGETVDYSLFCASILEKFF